MVYLEFLYDPKNEKYEQTGISDEMVKSLVAEGYKNLLKY